MRRVPSRIARWLGAVSVPWLTPLDDFPTDRTRSVPSTGTDRNRLATSYIREEGRSGLLGLPARISAIASRPKVETSSSRAAASCSLIVIGLYRKGMPDCV